MTVSTPSEVPEVPERTRRLSTVLPVRRSLAACVRGFAIGMLSLTSNPVLFAFFLVSLVLVPIGGIGIVMLPVVAAAVRWRANLHRRLAAGSGVPIPKPYRKRPDARYSIWRRFRFVIQDPATWRDVAWLLPGAIVAGACGMLAWVLPLYGIEGIVVIPLALYPKFEWYGYGVFWPLENKFQILASIPQGIVMLALGLIAAPWLTRLQARFASFFLRPARSAQLAERVKTLTESRADTVDTQAAELRRIERDLHDGPQARMVSVGMSIGLAQELMERDPAAAAQLLTEARQSSGEALADLRRLVRGIHPPVLAERGLDGAVRALALHVTVPVAIEIELSGRAPAPVESAVYFAVAEALANIAKHSGASTAWIRLTYAAGRLAVEVGDNGRGGATASAGSGLRGIQRRLAAFDATMTLTSPPGGPTTIRWEVPCELSSPRTSPSSWTA